ncbi:MAG TPA: ATP-binding protein [Blastocatellia bacterium]|nr:ATP-binding protein [Blastocatellia bacterium]
MSLGTLKAIRQESGRVYLLALISQCENTRPHQRALKAIEQYDREIEELVKGLPEVILVSGAGAVSALSDWIPPGWRRLLIRLRRPLRPVTLRTVAFNVFRKRARTRAKIEGRYLLAMALALRQLRHPWRIVRDALDAAVLGRPRSRSEVEAEWLKMRSTIEQHIHQAERELCRWTEESKRTLPVLAQEILSDLVWQRRKSTSTDDYRIKCVAHWASQMRAVNNELRLESALEECERHILDRIQRALESLILERSGLLAELDDVIAWLRRQMEQDGQEDFPPPKADLVPASGRLSELETALKAELESLPSVCETPIRFSALPRRRTRWKRLYPRDTFRRAFERRGRPEVTRLLEEVESQHRVLVQQIERAREVVAYGLEEQSDEQLVREAQQNALSLLEFHRREVVDWRPAVEPQMARALAEVFAEGWLILTRHRLGTLAYLSQQGFRRALTLVGQSVVTITGYIVRRLVSDLERLTLEFLSYIGWRPASSAGKVEVITRPFLPEEFVADLSVKELPALYRRLFRFEPLEDPRFLVGREHELAAITDARSLWEAGRPVALIIVGQRGSGKTSLINCALKRPLEGLEVIRGEFSDRLVTEAQLRDFLARLVGADDATEVEKSLAARRRVIILEELERTFLRQVGHYGAIRALQRVIAATSSTVLWVLSINETAFRFLDAAIRLGSSFSHRINVGTATRDELRQAILRRHNLSGLRLYFAPPPRSSSLPHRLRNLIQGETDPETVFFDALARESAGIYRTAFDIWLGQIETIEAGVLSLKPLVTPNLSPVIDDLDLEDLFTLVAILQHGSLTAEEHATIFQRTLSASRSQLDELLAREIIEPDPGRHGLRVRPEAMRVVREALYRRNLL